MENQKPKHKVISEWIDEKIENGEFLNGEKIPSENELSVKFNFSRQTVRQAISSLEANGQLIRVKGCGTFVKNAPDRFKEKTKNIGVIITYLDDYVFPSIVQGIESILTNNEYTMTLGITYNKFENEAKALRQMLNVGVDGIIVEGTKSSLPNPNISIYKKLKQENIPCIFINGYYQNIGEGYVVVDDVKGGSALVKELIKNGHKSIGGIFKSDDMQGHKRFEGYAKEMVENGLIIEDNAVIWYTTEDLNYFFNESYEKMIFERLKDCTAVVCYNDLVAVKLIKLLMNNGKNVPTDVSIVSFDNSSLASKSLYDLTSVIYPSREIGEKAAEAVLNKIKDSKANVTLKIETKIIKRNSVQKLK